MSLNHHGRRAILIPCAAALLCARARHLRIKAEGRDHRITWVCGRDRRESYRYRYMKLYGRDRREPYRYRYMKVCGRDRREPYRYRYMKVCGRDRREPYREIVIQQSARA